MSHFLELSRLYKSFDFRQGPLTVVKDFTLSVQGRIHHGDRPLRLRKSTVLSMIAGLTDVSAGGIILAGKEVTGAGPDRGVVFSRPACSHG
jgi:ABC-type taurine transport system ATPase subunit